MTRTSRAYYSANPQLISLMNGGAQGFKAVGDALVSLGDDKVRQAKEQAAKNELKAKEAALSRATAAKNMALNPETVRKVQQNYGIDEGSPLARLDAPTQANADIGLVDFGKADKPLKPSYDNYKTVGKTLVDVNTGKAVYSAPDDGTGTAYRDKYVEFYTGEDGNRIGVKGNGQKVVLGKVKDYQQSVAAATKEHIVPLDTLPAAQKAYVMQNQLYMRDAKGVPTVNMRVLDGWSAPARSDKDIGDIEVD